MERISDWRVVIWWVLASSLSRGLFFLRSNDTWEVEIFG